MESKSEQHPPPTLGRRKFVGLGQSSENLLLVRKDSSKNANFEANPLFKMQG